MMKMLHIAMALGTLALGATAAIAQPIVINGVQYGTTGSTENLSATFTQPDGGVTTGLYDNYVEITVSGVGMSYATFTNDAFYVLDNGAPYNDSQYYQMTFATTTLTGYDPGADIKNDIIYDLLTHTQVTAPYVPALEANDTYSFIIDTGSLLLTNLHFGVSDGQYSDNSGAYSIDVTQLAAIPEPASLALLGLGAAGLIAARRRGGATPRQR